MTAAVAEYVLTESEAQRITSEIRTWVKSYPAEAVAKAYQGRIWIAMGYESWAEWCDCELDGFKLPTAERREAVAELSQAGLSNRTIASALGINKDTVRNDKAELEAGGEFSPPDSVVGQDGKTYTKPKLPPGFSAGDIEALNGNTTPRDSGREAGEKPWRHAQGEPDEQQRANWRSTFETFKSYTDTLTAGLTGTDRADMLDYLKSTIARMENSHA